MSPSELDVGTSVQHSGRGGKVCQGEPEVSTRQSTIYAFVYRKPPCSDYNKVKSLSRVQLFSNPWTIGYQVPPSMGFSRQEYWSGLPFPSPGHFPDPGIEPGSPVLQADTLRSEPPQKYKSNREQRLK